MENCGKALIDMMTAKDIITLDELLKISQQLLEQIMCVNRGYIHGDIKTDNVAIHRDTTGLKARLIDLDNLPTIMRVEDEDEEDDEARKYGIKLIVTTEWDGKIKAIRNEFYKHHLGEMIRIFGDGIPENLNILACIPNDNYNMWHEGVVITGSLEFIQYIDIYSWCLVCFDLLLYLSLMNGLAKLDLKSKFVYFALLAIVENMMIPTTISDDSQQRKDIFNNRIDDKYFKNIQFGLSVLCSLLSNTTVINADEFDVKIKSFLRATCSSELKTQDALVRTVTGGDQSVQSSGGRRGHRSRRRRSATITPNVRSRRRRRQHRRKSSLTRSRHRNRKAH